MCAFDTESYKLNVSPSPDHDHHIMLLFKSGNTALHPACIAKGVEVVKLLIENEVDVRAMDKVSNDVMCAYIYNMI